MAKKTELKAVAEMMPDELTALKAVVTDFIGQISSIDNEIETLKEDRKEVIDAFSDKLDVKTLNAALRVTKIQSAVVHRDAFDLFCEVLTTA